MSKITEVTYRPDSADVFDSIADEPWAQFLDSGPPDSRGGRYDILVADPYMWLRTWGERTFVESLETSRESREDPFELLRGALGPVEPVIQGLPFCGGALGWFAYDLGRRIERLPVQARDGEALPDMAVALYDWALVVDHEQRRSHLVAQGRDERTEARWEQLVETFSVPRKPRDETGFKVDGEVRFNLSQQDYSRAFQRIKDYIRDGDCYQVNFAQRFSAPAEGNAWQAYRDLRRLNPAPYAAYLNTPDAQVLSSSPERFLSLSGGRVITQPIKGTRPRAVDAMVDARLAAELANSAKDRAENLMIVDLLRNDLGRVCRPGSVQVPELFRVCSYATVHHLVSTVSGRLAEGEDACSLLRACFPGGSITGAPKVRAMQIIEELEPDRRGVYCGSIGYLGFDGNMDTNIAIRTLVHNQGEIRGWAGGGLVQDSDLEAEYQETFHKADALLKLLEAWGAET